MRKFLLLILASLLGCAMAMAVDVRLDIDDASRVKVLINDDPAPSVVTGLNTYSVSPGTYVRVQAVAGCTLVSVTETNDGWESEMPIHAEDGVQFCDIMVYSDYGDVYVVKTASTSDTRTAVCTIDVDDAAKVKVVRVSDDAVVSLSNGSNEYKFDPRTETQLSIVPVDKPLYSVTLDGVAVESNGYRYTVTLTPGCVLSIKADYPDVDCPVHLQLSGDDAQDFITGADVNGRPVFDYASSTFTVKAGSELKLYARTNEYEVLGCKVNGVSTAFSNPFTMIITEETTIAVTVQKYASFKMVVNVDDPARVKVYKGYSYNGDQYTLHAGANTVEVLRNTPIISIVPADGCYLKSVVVDGYSYDEEDLRVSPLMVGSLTSASVLNITTGVINRNLTATVSVDYDGDFTLLRSDRTQVDVNKTGDTTFSFYEGDNPFTLRTSDISGIKVAINGVAVQPTYPDSPDYQFRLAQGDVLSITSVASGIESVASDNAEIEYFNLQGIRVDNPAAGQIYIIRTAGNVQKVIR